MNVIIWIVIVALGAYLLMLMFGRRRRHAVGAGQLAPGGEEQNRGGMKKSGRHASHASGSGHGRKRGGCH